MCPRRGPGRTARTARRGRSTRCPPTSAGSPTMEQHFILCGLGRVGWRALDYLRSAGSPVVVVDTHCQPDDARLAGLTLVRGDCRRQEVLEQAGVRGARGVLILTSDDLVNLPAALMVRHLNPQVRVVVRLFNQGLVTRLGKVVGNVLALSTSALVAPLLALIARTGEALGTFALEDGGRLQVAEVTLRDTSPLCGRRLGSLPEAHTALVLAHRTPDGTRRLLHEIDPEATLAAGDRLVLCGEPDLLAPLLTRLEDETLPELLWAGVVRRFGRMLRS